MPIATKPAPITFTFEGVSYVVDASLPFLTSGLVLLPDGRLLRAAGFDEMTPFNITVVAHKIASASVAPTA